MCIIYVACCSPTRLYHTVYMYIYIHAYIILPNPIFCTREPSYSLTHMFTIILYSCSMCADVSWSVCNSPTGRSVQIHGRDRTIRHNSEILKLAIEVGFDWVILESQFTVRLSVIPDCKHLREMCVGKVHAWVCYHIVVPGHCFTNTHTFFESLASSCMHQVSYM